MLPADTPGREGRPEQGRGPRGAGLQGRLGLAPSRGEFSPVFRKPDHALLGLDLGSSTKPSTDQLCDLEPGTWCLWALASSCETGPSWLLHRLLGVHSPQPGGQNRNGTDACDPHSWPRRPVGSASQDRPDLCTPKAQSSQSAHREEVLSEFRKEKGNIAPCSTRQRPWHHNRGQGEACA